MIIVATMLACSLPLAAQGASPVEIQIQTQQSTPLAPGFSGVNQAQLRDGVEFYDPKFVAAAKPLKAGWVRFPGGTVSMAYDWNPADPYGGHINIAWMNSLTQGNPPLVSGQSANILQTSQLLTQAKGGVNLSDFATFAQTLGAAGIICFNSYTDNDPGSASQMAAAAQGYGLNVLEWELGNEAYLYPLIYPTAGYYAAAVYSPDFTGIMSAAPTAAVGLFPAGQFTGSSVNTSNWDSQLASYTPQYWNAASTHIYPIAAQATAQTTMWTLNGLLAHGSIDYINSYLVPVVGANTPIFVTEFNCCSGYNNIFLAYLYNGIFLAEYIARLSSLPNVKGVGVNSLYTTTDYHGLLQSANGSEIESYLISQVQANPNYSTDTATNPNTQYQFYMSAPGLAMQVANQAINNSSQAWQTTVTGGVTVNILGYDGNPIPSVYAQAYRGNNNTHYLLITNKAAAGQNATIVFNGSKLAKTLNLSFVSSSAPLAMNTAQSPNTVQIQTASGSNPIYLRPYSVTCVSW